MRIFMVIGHINGGIYAQFFPSKTLANNHIKECQSYDYVDLSIDEYEIVATRQGMADAMNHFVHIIALNDS